MRKNIVFVLWGLLFIGIGIGLIGNVIELWDYKIFFDGWWTLFLIIPALISLVQNGFKAFNLILLSVGVLFLLERQQIIPDGVIAKSIVPALFIVVGILILSKIFKKNSSTGDHSFIKFNAGSESRPDYLAIFSGNKVKNISKALSGGSATAIFGGNEIDLSEALLSGDMTFTVTSIFGGNDIRAPLTAKVEMRGIPILGGNENNAQSCADPNAHTITFICTSIFGGTEIK
jgi:hypothetical protein